MADRPVGDALDAHLAANRQLWTGLRCAAIIAGYKGVEQLARDLDRPGLSYRQLRRLSSPDWEAMSHTREQIADIVSEHCRELGATVPAGWLLHGFDE